MKEEKKGPQKKKVYEDDLCLQSSASTDGLLPLLVPYMCISSNGKIQMPVDIPTLLQNFSFSVRATNNPN